MRSIGCIIHSNDCKGVMCVKQFDLSGFQLCHLTDVPHSILKEKRLVLRLTQQQVADKAGIALQQYQKFESGARNINTASFQIACRVIEALEMNVSDFYHGEYVIGEKVFIDDGGLHYQNNGESVDKDF